MTCFAGPRLASAGGQRLAEAREPPSRARSAARSHRVAARSDWPAAFASCAAEGAPFPRQIRVGGQERLEGSARQADLLGGKGAGQDGVTGEGMSEPEAGPLDVDELGTDGLPQELGGLVVVESHRGWRPGASRSGGRAARRR